MSGNKFVIQTYTKGELAAHYKCRVPQLRAWLMKNKQLWKKLNYNDGNLLTPSKVKMIVEFLGEPETIFDE